MIDQQVEQIENIDTKQENVETSQHSSDEIDYKKFYEDNNEKVKNTDAILAKNRELLGKMAKTKEARDAVQRQMDEQNGNWEKLYKEQQATIRTKTVASVAKDIANKLAGDEAAAEALAELLDKRVSDLVDETGEFDINDIEALKKDIESNKKYSRLLGDRNKGVGSNALGNAKPASVNSVKEMTADEYHKLDPVTKSRTAEEMVQGKIKLI